MHHKLSFRRKLQAFFLSLLLVLLTAAGVPSAAYTAEAASADTTMAVHFLDVGQGLSILVQSRGENLLYDGGDRGHSSFVVSYLQKQNISIIDYMISSHYDEDHVAGLVGCLDSFSVKNVIGADYIQDTKICHLIHKCKKLIVHTEKTAHMHSSFVSFFFSGLCLALLYSITIFLKLSNQIQTAVLSLLYGRIS